jgi:peptidylprolyl isomerase
MKKTIAMTLLCLAAAAPAAAFAADGDGDKPAAPAPAAPAAAPECKVEVVTKGEGRAAAKDDIALVQLKISLAASGRVLLDSHKEGDPQVVPLGSGNVFQALDETVAKMRVGDVWKVEAPYQRCFGEKGYGRAVPPKADLLLEVELVGFVEIKTEVLKKGDGPLPALGDLVMVHYTGWLPPGPDGKEGEKFDSSRDRDEPLVVTVGAGQVIGGWDLTLRKMRVGDRWKVTIPWSLGYGAQGKPPKIPGKTDLVFDIERLALPEIKSEVVAEGKGPLLQIGQSVKVHYTGTLLDGTKFDSSRDRGEPFQLVLGAHGVIPGWEMALVKMRVGDHWKVTIPWMYAYGASGRPPSIPPKADLVFDMEVVEAK